MSSGGTVASLRQPGTVDDPLTGILRDGARRQSAQADAEAFLAAMRDVRLPDGRGPEPSDPWNTPDPVSTEPAAAHSQLHPGETIR